MTQVNWVEEDTSDIEVAMELIGIDHEMDELPLSLEEDINNDCFQVSTRSQNRKTRWSDVVEKRKKRAIRGESSTKEDDKLGRAPESDDPSLSRTCSEGEIGDRTAVSLHYPKVTSEV